MIQYWICKSCGCKQFKAKWYVIEGIWLLNLKCVNCGYLDEGVVEL